MRSPMQSCCTEWVWTACYAGSVLLQAAPGGNEQLHGAGIDLPWWGWMGRPSSRERLSMGCRCAPARLLRACARLGRPADAITELGFRGYHVLHVGDGTTYYSSMSMEIGLLACVLFTVTAGCHGNTCNLLMPSPM